jgi:hypothetical protein
MTSQHHDNRCDELRIIYEVLINQSRKLQSTGYRIIMSEPVHEQKTDIVSLIVSIPVPYSVISYYHIYQAFLQASL